MSPPTQLRLSDVVVGITVEVSDIDGDELFRGRLLALGIAPGVSLSVVRGGRRNPLVIGLPGCRLMIDARSSERIMVRDPQERREIEAMSA